MHRYPPGPPQLTRLEFVRRFRQQPIDLLSELTREYGDIVQLHIGCMRVVVVNHPDQIREVLVEHSGSYSKSPTLQRARYLLGDGLLTSEGEVHARQQRLMRPAFQRERLDDYVEIVVHYSERLMQRWSSGQTTDVSSDMTDLTLSVVGKTLFGADFDSRAQLIEENYHAALACLRPFRPHLLFNPRLLGWVPGSKSWRFWKAKAVLDSLVQDLISQRRGGDHGKDLLSILCDARDVEQDGSAMNDRQVRDEVVTLILAGHETVAHALTWTWMLLAAHPDVERDLHAELDRQLGGRRPQPSDYTQLKLCRAVFSEALRLYPPVWVIARQAVAPVNVGGYVLPPGTVVAMSQYLVQRDKRWFPESEKFDPARWLSDDDSPRPKYAFFPFGGGPRYCLGESFAWMEALTVIATIARHWRLVRSQSGGVTLDAGFTLKPRDGMPMTVHSRTPGGRGTVVPNELVSDVRQ